MTQTNLKQLLNPLNEDFTAKIIEPHSDINMEQLFVELPADTMHRQRQLELLILPDEDGVCFLQYFISLPYTVDKNQINELSRLILKINAKLPLIGFGLLEEMQLIFFRCIVPCPDQPLEDDVYVHTAHMILYILDNFGPILESLGNTEMSYDECINELMKYEND